MASRGRAEQPPRPHGQSGRAPRRRRRGGGRVAASAGRYGERPSGAGLVEPQTSPLECRGTRQRQHAAQSRGRGEEHPRAQGLVLRTPSRIADLQRSTQRASTNVSHGPGTAGGWEGDHRMRKVVVRRPVRFWCTAHLNACESAKFPGRAVGERPHCRWVDKRHPGTRGGITPSSPRLLLL